MSAGRRRVTAAALAVTAGVTAGLTGVAGAAPGGSSTSASGSSGSCAWLARSDDDTVNAAYPDTSATYWISTYTVSPGESLVVHGRFPRARYFSFHTYTATGVTLDSVFDRQIRPDAGSGNPFRHRLPAGQGRDYTVTLTYGDAPKRPAPNTVYAGSTPVAGTPNVSGILIYRIYTPDNPRSANGGVPLPSVTPTTATGSGPILGGCETPQPTTGGAINRVYRKLGEPASGPRIPIQGAKAVPVWRRSSSNLTVAGLFGNQQNAYLTTRTSLQYGPVLVIRARAPSFPDTRRGAPSYRHTQVRYWSVCQNSSTTRVVSCVPDAAAPRRHGYVTIVISTAGDRPARATRRHGIAWIPWGAQPDGVLIYRNMVAAASFAHATQRVSPSDDARRVMGSYYPAAHYCSTASFDRHGPRRCTTNG